MRIMNYIKNTFSILSLKQVVKAPITAKNSVSILYFIQGINNMFSRRPEILQSLIRHNQAKWIKILNN